MNTKILSLIAGLFLILSLVSVSALTLSTPSDINTASNKTFSTITSADPVNVTVSLVSPSGLSTSFTPSSFLNFTGTSRINISLDSIASTVKFGTYTYNLSVFAVNSSNSAVNTTQSVAFNYIKSFCRSGDVGTNLSLGTVSVKNLGAGKNTDWKLLDRITVDVDVRNEGDNNMGSVYARLALLDSSGKDVTSNLNFVNTDEDEISIGTIDHGKKERASFEFDVSPDFTDDTYKLVVKAYSKKSGLSEDLLCVDTSSDLSDTYFDSIAISKESDKAKRIGFTNIKLSSDKATCGDAVTLTADAVNVGDTDEDQVKIDLTSADLGLTQSVELKGGLSQGDSSGVQFSFIVPQNLQDKAYKLELSADYDYRSGVYRQSLNNPEDVPLTIFGCSVVNTPTSSSGALVTATLASDAKAGQPLTVNVNLKNTGSSSANFVVDATGYDSWASKATLSDRIVTLAAGESKDITVTLNVNSGVSGSQTFNVMTVAGQSTSSKTVSVNVAAVEGVSLGGNTLLWVIGAINLILVIVIIIVAVRVSRR